MCIRDSPYILMNLIKRYVINLLLAVDQLANTVLLGHPDETLSSRLGRSIGQERYVWVKWFRCFVDWLFWVTVKQKDHSLNSIIALEQQSFRNFDYEIWCWNK